MSAKARRRRLPKAVAFALMVAAIVLALICAWFIGYHMRKSTDNLPALEHLMAMQPDEANDLLLGYKRVQLEQVWGDPASSNDGSDTWKLDGGRAITVYYSGQDTVRDTRRGGGGPV